FISIGAYERHLRRTRQKNARRREALLDSVHKHLGSRVRLTGEGSGAHVVLWPRRRISEKTIVAQAAAHNVGIYGISPYFLSRPDHAGLMLGYSRMKEQEIREGIRRLADITI